MSPTASPGPTTYDNISKVDVSPGSSPKYYALSSLRMIMPLLFLGMNLQKIISCGVAMLDARLDTYNRILISRSFEGG